jgi:hypothetical protein
MPKAFLKFNLPEEKEEFEAANNGGLYKLAIWDLDQHLRGVIKYNSDSYDDKTLKAFQMVRDTLHEILSDYDLKID